MRIGPDIDRDQLLFLWYLDYTVQKAYQLFPCSASPRHTAAGSWPAVSPSHLTALVYEIKQRKIGMHFVLFSRYHHPLAKSLSKTVFISPSRKYRQLLTWELPSYEGSWRNSENSLLKLKTKLEMLSLDWLMCCLEPQWTAWKKCTVPLRW